MKNYLILVLLSLTFLKVNAQDPNWYVNASNYQYSMTFTTFLNVNGTALSSSEDKVGAFVNGEVRGVSNVQYIESANKYLVYLSVYANTNGETISFKIFDSVNQKVVDVTETQSFTIDEHLGGVFQSYSIASPALNDEAILNSFTFKGISSVSQAIGNNKVDIVLPVNTDITNLSAEFGVSNGAVFYVDNVKQVSEVSIQDFTNSITYKLVSENEAELKEYEVNVTLETTNIQGPVLVLNSGAKSFVNQSPTMINLETNVAITGFSMQDVLLTNAVVSSLIKVDDYKYTLQIVPIQQGVFSIKIPKNVVFNAENKGNDASNVLNFTYDVINPYVMSIKRKNPIDEITDNDTLEYTVTFNEAVENVVSTDFKSVLGATIKVIKETETKYIVTITDIEDFIGSVMLNIKPTNTITDKTGNPLMNSVINVNQN